MALLEEIARPCVHAAEKVDDRAFAAWMAEMGVGYHLASEQTYRVKLNGPREPDRFGRYMVYEFRARMANEETAQRGTTSADVR